jgi:hypothetical protein
MDELRFVIKCFIFSCLLFAASQIKTDGHTLEARVQGFLVSSTVAEFMNQSAHGGAKLFLKGWQLGSKNVSHISGRILGSNRTEEKQIIRNPSAMKTDNNSDFQGDNQLSTEDIEL